MDLIILTECVCVCYKSCQVMSNKAESLFHSVFLIVDVIKAQPPFCKFLHLLQVIVRKKVKRDNSEEDMQESHTRGGAEPQRTKKDQF